MSKPTRRFIAGASCPKCNEQDSLAMVMTDDSSYVECVECGHVQHEPGSDNQTPGLIATFNPNQD
ncbi:YheV family putative metal-binding protein [Neiella sp. HB171785]|uniref:YheV family putative metal-binding protein n=1 Tax=Neiella litorisoli TaxID=2771431 RepID=A0A8J6QEB6_9GAMM|nr:YheV family putative zinc ribbon protein [Neiella litorisoli]MBD1387969.1 YheV family putative metal-binding protein [Neiella litorisoli]